MVLVKRTLEEKMEGFKMVDFLRTPQTPLRSYHCLFSAKHAYGLNNARGDELPTAIEASGARLV